jgi:VWFA-related protein
MGRFKMMITRLASTVVLFLALVAAGSTEAPQQDPRATTATKDAAAPTPKPAATPSEPPPTFGAEVELVTVDAVVASRKGEPVAGLRKEDFLLTEDDKAQSIVSFEAIELPELSAAVAAPSRAVSTNVDAEARTARTFAVLVDDIHLTHIQAFRAKEAVREFLKKGVREGDRVLLVSSSGSAWWSARMEAGREQLLAIVDRLEGRRTLDENIRERVLEYEALRIIEFNDYLVCQRVERRFQESGLIQQTQEGEDEKAYSSCNPFVESRAQEVFHQSMSRARITLATMERVFEALGTTRGRKSMILVSEGFVYNPLLDAFREVIQASRRANVAVYFLGTRGLDFGDSSFKAESNITTFAQDLGAMHADEERETEGPESIADDTGGFSVKNTNDLGQGIARIADESRAYYLLGYNPTNTERDGKFRKIGLKVNRKGVTVRARRGYYAAGGAKTLEVAEGDTPPELKRAIDAPFEVDGIALRMASYVFDETLLGRARVLVAADIDITKLAFEEQDGRFVDTVDVFLGVVHRESGEFFQYPEKVAMKLKPATREKMSWYPVVKDFDLAPGNYQAKLVVRDHNSHRVGSVFHNFEVPDLGQLRVSTPVLSDTLAPEETPGASPQPRLLARREFPASGTLYCQLEVFGAAKDKETGMPSVTQGYVLLRSGGGEARRMDPLLIRPGAKNEVARLFGFPLSEVAPGDYEMIITIKDEVSGKTKELREAFRVVAAPGG